MNEEDSINEETVMIEDEFDMIDKGLEKMTRSFRNLNIEQKLRENSMWK